MNGTRRDEETSRRLDRANSIATDEGGLNNPGLDW